MIQQITPLPTPPQPSDSPTVFDQRAFALLGGLPQFVTEANALGSEIFTIGEDASQSAASALDSKNAAATSASQALDQANASSQSASDSASSANAANQSRIDAQAAAQTAVNIAGGMEMAIAMAQTFTVVPTTLQSYVIFVTQPHFRTFMWNGAKYIRAPWHQPGDVRHVYRDLRPGELEVRADVTLQSADFPDLAEYLGITGPTFVLDEARAEFIRNADSGRGKDAGRVVGSHQGDAGRNLTGTVGQVTRYFNPTGAFYEEVQANRPTTGAGDTGQNLIKLDASRQWPTANEFRVTNLAYRLAITY